MRIIVAGSGTSTGVPTLGCGCNVCTSKDPRDNRTRASILIQTDEHRNIVIDTGPDFRTQMLRYRIDSVDAVLFTHFHYDHVGGIDDLRPYSQRTEDPLPCYMNAQTLEEITRKMPYVNQSENYPNIPRLRFRILEEDDSHTPLCLTIAGIKFQPIRMVHVPSAGVFSTGFVIENKFGYLTDFKHIFREDERFLYNLDVLYLGSPLDIEHPTHISHYEAFELFQKFQPHRAVVGHLSHQHSHERLLEKWKGVAEPAHDGMVFDVRL